jgi:alpha-beta hydrolase superfamily lysophospholipase
MRHEEFTMKTKDGLQLYGQIWRPEEAPRAVMLLVHGIGEHSGRYVHLARFFTQAGLVVVSYDLRGHGKSEGVRGYIPVYESLLDDINLLEQKGRSLYPNLPVFLYGHSLGGNQVLNYGLRCSPALDGVIASGAELRLAFTPSPVRVALARLTDRLYPAYSQASGLDVNALSQDPQVIRDYQNDPLVHDRVSARLFTGFYDAGLWALEKAESWSLPLLIMHGSADAVCDAEASREFAEKAGPQATLKIWDNFYHEIHNEPQQQEVFAFTLEWIEGRLMDIAKTAS